jgi:hypothetical protein
MGHPGACGAGTACSISLRHDGLGFVLSLFRQKRKKREDRALGTNPLALAFELERYLTRVLKLFAEGIQSSTASSFCYGATPRR